MRKLHNQRGTVVFEVVLVILVLVAVGAAGYFAYQARNQKQDNSVSIKHKAVSVRAADNVIKFPELGFQMTVPADLKDDLEYQIDNVAHTDQDANGVAYKVLGNVEFTSKSLVASGGKNQYGQNNCALDGGAPLGVISEFGTNPDTLEIPSGPRDAKKIGTSYIGYSGPQAACGESAASNELETRQIKELQQAYDTITEIK